ncbi:MAG: fatty acid--CoA ligase family protein, partial [Bacteroidota bacterium]
KGKLFKKMLGGKKKGNTEGEKTYPEVLQSYPAETLPASVDPATIAYILFTSGTTSVPKAVQISHHALWANLATINEVYRLEEDSRIFNILTTYHTDGAIQGPVLAALNKATWYHPMEFAVDQIPRIFDSIYKYRITHFITVPTMLAFLLKFSEGFEDSFSGDEFKYIVTSASPFEKNLWEPFEKTFSTEVVNNYGLTETVAGASYCGPDADTRKVGSIGKPIGCSFKIVDEAGNELGANERGELLIQGPNMLTSYLNNAAATEAAIQDGWFYTGDFAERDENGFYQLIGRKKNLIITGGINVQPEEVSAIINTHPAVQESVCIGQEDELFGERVVACVVLESGQQMEAAELIDFCRQELEPAKVPSQLFFLPSLPKTISGKIQVRAVKELISQGPTVTADQQNTFMEGILNAASEAFQVPKEQLGPTSSAANVDGWDSMAHLLFITNLEKEFKL